MSTKWPSTAAAAAICGETRCERAPRPWRPSKLRLDVEATRSPGAAMSGFIPRHMEQPAVRQSKPALRKTSSRPSRSAWARTCWEPGTTIASMPLEAHVGERPDVGVRARLGHGVRDGDDLPGVRAPGHDGGDLVRVDVQVAVERRALV